MSLATRCTACGTVFRVVQDQLKVSEGWVRCGRCNEVFNALEGLFDLERETAADWDRPPHRSRRRCRTRSRRTRPRTTTDASSSVGADLRERHPQPAAQRRLERPDGAAEPASSSADSAPTLRRRGVLDPSGRPTPGHQEPRTDRQVPDGTLDDAIDAHLFGARRASRRRTAGQVNERDRIDFSDARFDSDLFADAADADAADRGADRDAPIVAAGERGAAGVPAPRRAPGALASARGARRAGARRARPARRCWCSQVGHHFRDLVAARWPALRPALAAWCDVVGCRLEAPRRIDDVAGREHRPVTRGRRPDAFRLAVDAAQPRRRAAGDAVGRPEPHRRAAAGWSARKALAPRDFDAVDATLDPPGAEVVAADACSAAGDARVTGYTVEIFYP